MAKILIAWELGANFGHLARCAQISEALTAHGHQVVFALRNTAGVRRYLSGSAFVQAPLHVGAKRYPAPESYAEILLNEGYADPDTLHGLVGAWGHLLRMVSADAVIADHAPTAMFAAHCFGVPYLAVGNGFAIPPAVDLLPSIRPWKNIPVTRLQHASLTLTKVMADISGETGIRRRTSLKELFVGKSLIDSFSELDHYGPRPDVRYIGPIFQLSHAHQAKWMGTQVQRVLAYFHADMPLLPEIMRELPKLNAEVLAVVPGMPVQAARQYASASLRIALAPLKLEALLPDATLMITSGGAATTAQGLLAGVPQAIAPRYIEQTLLAKRMEDIGAGIMLQMQTGKNHFVESLNAALENVGMRESAECFKARYQGFERTSPIMKIVAATEEALSIGIQTNVLQ